VAKNLAIAKYKPAVAALMKKRGFQKAVFAACGKVIRNEIKACLSMKDLHLRKGLTLETLNSFNWNQTLHQLREAAPKTMQLMNCLLSPTTM
jgi:hypothetical protein